MFDTHWLQQVRSVLLEKRGAASFRKSQLRYSALCEPPEVCAGWITMWSTLCRTWMVSLVRHCLGWRTMGIQISSAAWICFHRLSPAFTIFQSHGSPSFNAFHHLFRFFTIWQYLFEFSRHPVAQCGTPLSSCRSHRLWWDLSQHGFVALLLQSPPKRHQGLSHVLMSWKQNGRIQETLRCFTFQASRHHAWWGTQFFENPDLLIIQSRSSGPPS